MTSPFKSTVSVASRRRQRPVVERSTFVVANVGDVRVAFPVEQVERVVRGAAGAPSPEHAAHLVYREHPLPVRSLGRHLGAADATAGSTGDSTHERVLIFRLSTGAVPYHAWRVNRVHEVFALETALVQPLENRNAAPFASPAVRGYFRHGDQRVWLLDATRLEIGS